MINSHKLLISEEKISEKVDSLAAGIAADLAGSSTIMVGLLNGSVVFLSDLMRRLFSHGLCLEIDFMAVESYRGSTTLPGHVEIVQDIRMDIAGRTVLLVDDIIDTGRTMSEVVHILEKRNPARILTCALLNKPSRREADIVLDYVGFEIEDKFVVGYGLDAGNMYRCMPYIATLEE